MIKVSELEQRAEATILPPVVPREELRALLWLARAASEYSDMTLRANDEEDEDTRYHLEDRAEQLWDEMQAALSAFDFTD